MLFVLNEVRLSVAMTSKSLLEVIIVVIIIVVLVSLALQYLLPYVRDANRTRKISDTSLNVAKIITGKPSPSLQDLILLLTEGTLPPLTDRQLVDMAKELNALVAYNQSVFPLVIAKGLGP